MRRKINRQAELDFKPSNLKVTNEYYQQYQAVSMLLDTNPEILTLVHKDIKQTLESLNSEIPDGHCKYSPTHFPFAAFRVSPGSEIASAQDV